MTLPGMTLPGDPSGRAALAGEYVLGTLDARVAAQVAVAVDSDPLWRQAVEEWEMRLAPLSGLTRPEAPPPDTWDRIEARIAPPQPAKARRRAQLGWWWRGWAIGATFVAAGLAAFVLVPRPQPARIMTVLVGDRNAPTLMAEIDRRGGLRLNAVAAATGRNIIAPSGRSLQLWALAPGATEPVSLSVLPHEPGKVTTITSPAVRPVPGMLIEISVEPEGGSPTGKPTGPVVLYGRLSEAGPDT